MLKRLRALNYNVPEPEILNAKDFNPVDVMLEAVEPIKLDYTNLEHRLKINYQTEIK